jgi:hypothetical protein
MQPPPIKAVFAAAFGVLLAAGGAYRIAQRRKLADLFRESDLFWQAQLEGLVGSPEEAAREKMPLVGMASAETVFVQVLMDLRPLIPETSTYDIPGDAARYAQETQERAQEAAQGWYQQLPDVPFIDTSSVLPSWVTGEEP